MCRCDNNRASSPRWELERSTTIKPILRNIHRRILDPQGYRAAKMKMPSRRPVALIPQRRGEIVAGGLTSSNNDAALECITASPIHGAISQLILSRLQKCAKSTKRMGSHLCSCHAATLGLLPVCCPHSYFCTCVVYLRTSARKYLRRRLPSMALLASKTKEGHKQQMYDLKSGN